MKAPAAPRLESAIRAELAPSLRSEGFAGTGRRFHRRSGPWLHVVTVQGSRFGGAFAVNLGVHFAAAPNVAGTTIEDSAMTEAHCEFRRRLSDTKLEMWWKHEPAQASMHDAVRAATTMYANHGRRLFELVCDSLSSLTPEQLESGNDALHGFGTTKVRMGLALARIRNIEGKVHESRRFAEYVLKHLGPAAFLKAELESLTAL